MTSLALSVLGPKATLSEVVIADKTVRVVLEALVSGYKAKMSEATAANRAFGASALKVAGQHQAAFNTVGLAGLALAAGVGFAFKAAADAAIEFESSFAGVRKTVDATDEGFRVLSDGLRDMATEIPVNVNGLNEIAAAAGQLGVSGDAILGFTEVVAKMGVTTDLATDQAANALARISNIMGTPQDEFDRMGATIVALGNAGASTEAEIVDFALRIAGAGKIAGMTEADILGLSAAFLDVGIPAEAGGTAVQKAMLTMTSSVVTGGEKLETFAATAGMSADEFAAAWQADAAGAFISFIEGLGQQGQQGILTLQELFGVNERVARSFLSVASAGDNARGSVELGNVAWEENIALNDEAAKRFETTASKMQLASNQINDAAIAFGQLLLPAIAAVVGAVADVAALFGDLPGPVKVAATVLALVAGGLAAVGGAALLLLPRLLQVKLAMGAFGMQGGLIKGTLSSIVGAINPWTVGIAAVTAGLFFWAQKTAEAKQRVEELTSAIQADTGALGENVRGLVAQRLEQSGALEAAQTLGLGLADVTDAVIQGGSAWREMTVDLNGIVDTWNAAHAATGPVTQGMDDQAQAASDLLGIVGGLGGELDAATASAARQAEALGTGAEATDEAGVAAGGAAGDIDLLGDEIEDTATLADQLTEALEGLAGTSLDVEEANLRWLDSIAGINDELTHQVNEQGNLTDQLLRGVRGLDETTEAGRAMRNQILDSIDAAITHGAAVAEETGSLQRGARAVRAHVKEIIAEAVEAGVSERAMRDYIAQLNLTPKQIKTALELLGAEEAIEQIEDIRTGLMNLPVEKRISIIISREGSQVPVVPHAGGMIGSSRARRYHGGGMPGLRGDEVPAILQRGEFVISKQAARRLGPRALSMLNRMHSGGSTGGSTAGDSNFLERQFAKLEKAMDDAASLIKEAIADGLDRQSSETAREMSRAIAEKQRRFDKMLEQARDHLADIREKMRGFQDAIRSGFSTGGDLLSGAASLGEEIKQAQMEVLQAQIDAAEESGAAQPIIDALEAKLDALRDAVVHAGPEQMATFLAAKLKENQDFAAALRQLSELGLNTGMLAELAEAGPEELPFMQALIAGGAGMIDAFNATEAAIGAIGHELADDLGEDRFGDAIDSATRSITRLNERMAEVIDRLGDRLRKFLEAVQADTTAQKFNDLRAALDRIINSLNGAPGGGGGGAGSSSTAPAGRDSARSAAASANGTTYVTNVTVPVSTGVLVHDREVGTYVAEKLIELERRGGRHHG